MICIYSQNNTNYQANGDAVLEPLSCDLEITINVAWSLTLEHPYDPEEKYKYIVEGAVIRADIRCIRELTGIRQLFRVYDYKKGLHSVTAIAFPIAMESTYDAPIDNLVIQNKTGIQAMADLQTKTNKYTLATDITKIASSSFANTNVNSAIASGSNNCFIKVWGGEILYDNLTFNVKSRIGDIEAGDHQVTYGHNLTDITYTKDDSGLITRIYPISQDGIRLNGSGYVDSPKISDYPVIHSHFIQAPYTLINTDAASPSQTAQQTRTSGATVNTSANTLALSSYSTALAAGYEPEYIKEIRQEIIQAVQTMALSSVISTSLYNYLNGIISNAMSFMSELEQPAWDWMGSWEDGWKYGNENGYAVSRYVKIGKTWSYLNAEGYWEEPRDDSGTWDWYQAQADPGRRYGNFTHYYAHNENVYITMSGTLTKYYFDSDGWYDDSKTEASTWDWHGSGTASDPYWFGESGATSEESNKYAHDCWLFIDGSLYFFDHFGYYTPGNKFADYQWDWVETSDGFWFGNAIDQTYGAVYLKSQWAKINGDWIYFDENGYAVQENASQSAAVEVFTTGMAGLKTVVDAQTTILYDLLYSLMTQYANSRYAAGVDVPAVTITVDMADLSKTTEYAGFENLETVKLGDAVICTDNEHNISMTSRVIGLTYDCIRDYNSTVVIGKAGASISSIVGNANSEVVSGGFDTTALEAQIAALQNKVGDIFMNDASIVSNGVGRFAIQPGTNISISRSGNTLTINSTGGDGDVNLYHGVTTPSDSLGDDNDIYIQLAPDPTSFETMQIGGGYNGVKSWTMTDANKVYHYTSVWQTGYIYHAGQSIMFQTGQLTAGKRYILHLDAISDNGIWNSSGDRNQGEFYGIAYQKQNNIVIHDGRTTEHVSNGGFEYLSQYGSGIYYQSFVHDHKRHTYEFEFEATAQGYLMIYGDDFADSGEYNLEITNMYITDGEDELAIITNIYYKIEGEWLLNESGKTYEAGDNIQISEQNVISATDTDEIAELEDVNLTNLADGEILKYNATTQKWENAEDSGGSEVEANPSGTATDTLTKLGIDGTVYEIQGGGGGGSNLIVDAEIYSLEEKQVGVWTDGKPIYKRTWILSNEVLVDSNGITISEIDASIIEHLIGCNGGYQPLSNTKSIPIMVWKYNNTWYYGSSINAYIDTVTLTYTKTTDTAGSGGFQAYGFTPIIYSTEEREVGVWTNGKPLYAKTFIQQLSGNAGQVDISAVGADMMFAHSGYYDIGVTMLGLNERLNNQYLTYTHVNLDTMQYIDCTNTIAPNSTIVVCCLYTKTTDVAGSAQYTTLGVPAVHYDGEERIIGTWFGETLYEKIINFDYNNIQSRTSSGCEIYINVPNIKDTKDSLILFEGGIIQFPYFVNTSIFIGGFTQTETDTFHISLRYSSSVYSELNAYLTDCRVKLQYTKTS